MTNEEFLKELTMTRLEGMKSVLSHAIKGGEILYSTTVDELLNKIEGWSEEKNKGYKSRLKDIKESNREDEMHR